MKVLIGTNNKGKVEGAKQAFEKFYTNVEVIGVSVNSDVSDEPVNDEIYKGASNRVNNLIKYAEEICRQNKVNSLKVDTHEENIPMQNLLKKNGFKYCGIIYLEDGGKRVAFEKTL